MSARDELIDQLRILDADDRRLPFHDMRLAAADLLERDGAEIASLLRWKEDAVRNCAQKRCGRKDARIAELEREISRTEYERHMTDLERDALREIVAREYGGYAYPDEVEAMARELLLARAVIEAVRRHAHYGCCVSTWQDAAEAMREYDAAYPQEGAAPAVEPPGRPTFAEALEHGFKQIYTEYARADDLLDIVRRARLASEGKP